MDMLDPATMHDDPPCYTLSEQSDIAAAEELRAIIRRLEAYGMQYRDQDDEYGISMLASDMLLKEAMRLEDRADQ